MTFLATKMSFMSISVYEVVIKDGVDRVNTRFFLLFAGMAFA